MAKTVRCQNCQGNGTVQVNEIKNGKSVWTTKTCHACGGSGKVNAGLL
jgi:DnaJ-class molecular chaperone